MPVEPEIKNFLIADRVFQDIQRKWNIIGIFDRVFAPSFPTILPSLDLYIRLTDAEGNYKVRVEFCDENDRTLALFKGFKLKIKSRLQYPDFGIKTSNLPIQKPGKYIFKLYMNENQVGSMPLSVEQIKNK